MTMRVIVKGDFRDAELEAARFGYKFYPWRLLDSQCIGSISGGPLKVYEWFNESLTAPFPKGSLLHFKEIVQ